MICGKGIIFLTKVCAYLPGKATHSHNARQTLCYRMKGRKLTSTSSFIRLGPVSLLSRLHSNACRSHILVCCSVPCPAPNHRVRSMVYPPVSSAATYLYIVLFNNARIIIIIIKNKLSMYLLQILVRQILRGIMTLSSLDKGLR